MMTNTEVSSRILGSAWPQHMNKTVAETMYANIVSRRPADVGRGRHQRWRRALQKELRQPQTGLATQIGPLRGRHRSRGEHGRTVRRHRRRVVEPADGDAAAIPSNIPGMPGHNWANAIAMATPIAHKGVTAGAKVQAMTIIDLLMRPELVQQAWDYFRNVQTKDQKYIPFITRHRPAGGAG